MQGKEDTLNRFIGYIKRASPGDIDHIDKEDMKDTKRYPGFEITF